MPVAMIPIMRNVIVVIRREAWNVGLPSFPTITEPSRQYAIIALSVHCLATGKESIIADDVHWTVMEHTQCMAYITVKLAFIFYISCWIPCSFCDLLLLLTSVPSDCYYLHFVFDRWMKKSYSILRWWPSLSSKSPGFWKPRSTILAMRERVSGQLSMRNIIANNFFIAFFLLLNWLSAQHVLLVELCSPDLLLL